MMIQREINPVFLNELRQSFLRRKPVQAFIIWTLVTGVMMFLAQYAPPDNPLTFLPMIALPLIVPAFAAGAFAKEYEQQTWQDLYLTRLTNLQVVLGKFFAALALTMATILSFIPPVILMLANSVAAQGFGRNITLVPGWWLVTLLFKLTLSASLYVLLAMTCSRYSANRRASMVWCYIALSLYAFFGFVIWSQIGQAYERNTQYLDGSQGIAMQRAIDPISPGFMGGIHLIFCCVVGIGVLILMWVSMSEQRGYRQSSNEDTARAWQPIGRSARRSI